MPSLATLKEILFDKHRPWLQDDKSEDYFKSQLLELKEAPVTSGSSFVIDAFPRPFNSKTRYYKRFIDNELQKLLQHYFEEIVTETNQQVLKYLALTILERQLKTLFTDLSRIIIEFDFSPSYIDFKKTSLAQDADHKASTYIIQYLKQAFIQLYLEIQLKLDKIVQEPLTLEDIYLQLLNETLPEKIFIKEIEIKEEFIPEAIEKPDVSKPQKPETDFIPIKDEVPHARPSKLNYSIIRNPNKFAEVEMNLYLDGIIDIDYYFIKNKARQNSTKLPAIIHILIRKNYFHKRIYGYKKEITPKLICQYFESRYNVKMDQQFRKLTDEKISFFSDKYRWIDQLRTLS